MYFAFLVDISNLRINVMFYPKLENLFSEEWTVSSIPPIYLICQNKMLGAHSLNTAMQCGIWERNISFVF